MLRSTGRAVRNGLAVIGIGAVGSGLIISQNIKSTRKAATVTLPKEFVLELDLETHQVVETVPFNPLQFLGQGSKQVEVRKVVRALGEAGGDERVKGVVAYVGDAAAGAGLAVVQELRSAVQDFRVKAGSRAACVAYADSFGEAGTLGTASYFLASGFDKVYVQPTGTVSCTGLAVEANFVRNLLDRWSIKRHIVAREEFKSAVERLTEEKFSGPSRLAMDRLLTSMTESITQGVAQSRGLTPQAVMAAIDEAPLPAARAVELRLLDGTKYRDEAVAEAGARLSAASNEKQQQPKRVPLSRYLRVLEANDAKRKAASGQGSLLQQLRAASAADGEDAAAAAAAAAVEAATGPEVAVVHAEGAIAVGAPDSNLASSPTIDSIKLCKVLRELRESKTVKAVVLRINSPGGSAVASDTIHREVSLLRASGRPVVVSMGNVCASGGYYISAPATRIVAQPSTITGSIGVIFGKLNVAEGLSQVGITTDIVSVGRNAASMSAFTDFTKQQQQKAEAMTDKVYEFFMQRVSEGRGLSREATRAIAKGRVWSGADALELGLVDMLGGLRDAVALARREAGLSEEDSEVVDYPKPKSRMQLVQSLLKGEPLDASMATTAGISGGVRERQLAALLLSGAGAGGNNGSDALAAVAAALVAGGAAPAGHSAAAAAAGPQMLCDITVR